MMETSHSFPCLVLDNWPEDVSCGDTFVLPLGVAWASSQRAEAKSDISQSRDRQGLYRLDPHSVRGHAVSPPLSDSQGSRHNAAQVQGRDKDIPS